MRVSQYHYHYMLCLFAMTFGLLVNASAQKVSGGGSLYHLSGTLVDGQSGESLGGAVVRVQPMADSSNSNLQGDNAQSHARDHASVSNAYGFFSIQLPSGDYQLSLSALGYRDSILSFHLDGNKTQRFQLERQLMKDSILDKESVEVFAQGRKQVTATQMGLHQIDLDRAAKLPVIFGERDVLKTLALLPGVQPANDGSAGFYVRGSSTGQNLILLDEAPVYNASHLFGFFSTFNSDAIKEVTLIKGNAGAKYGGRLASVLDVRMNEGNNQQYHVAGGIGLISSRISVEGPIKKNKSSFIVSGRRTYADLFLHLSNNEDVRENQLYFYDLNAKANIELNAKNHLYFSGYMGKDKLGIRDQFRIHWGNKTATIRWNSILKGGLFANTAFIFSDYRYGILLKSGNNRFYINSVIRDFHLKQDYDWYRGKGVWHFGWNSIYHQFDPTRLSGGNDSLDYSQQKHVRSGWENAVYLDYSLKMAGRWALDGGIRLSSYSVLGAGQFLQYGNQDTKPVDSVRLAKGQIGKTYINPEPRLAIRYELGPHSRLKAAYARNSQHLHLLSNSVATNPTDQWLGDSYNIRPETADQYSLGYYLDINAMYSLQVESYYKNLNGQIDYRNGADLTTSQDVESQLLYGKGRAYGLELYWQKKTGRLTGWLSYTLSKTEKKIAGINGNNWYNAKQDRTHNLSLVAIYPLSDRWSVSGDFMFSTGNAVTFPEAKYSLTEQTVFYYTKRNDYRMPNYHRMDINFTLKCKPHKHYQASWSFGLYNVYGRENAYVIRFKEDPDHPERTQAEQTSLFRWVPSITYNFKF